MNKILIVDASASNYRVMSSLLSRAGYDPLGVDSIEAGKVETAKLPPGARISYLSVWLAHGLLCQR